jgi:2,5-diamino-6-(ribosylamino)-4(3H)-pyrimidinone 5'-phosphate reductase
MYLYYGIAAEWNVDAALIGSNTVLMSGEPVSKEDETAFEPMKAEANDTRPMLVIADSKGRVRSWHDIKKWPYIREAVALCSRSTPKEYLEYLEKRHIGYIIAGEDQVDFKAALEELNQRYGVKKLRVDSGGTLNGVLLRAGLVDEVNLLIHPALVGGTSGHSMFRAPDLTSAEGVIGLKLKSSKKIKGGIVHLQYDVMK